MNHEGKNEGHEGHEGGLRRLRLPSPLPSETERVMTATIGCAISVHRALGPGFLESIYLAAMGIEMTARSLSFERERAICVSYRGVDIPGQRVDLLVEGMVVVELKAVRRFEDVHSAQVVSYLKTTGLRAGLLINFNVPLLRQGLKRFVR
jgi:GxxExxY protein